MPHTLGVLPMGDGHQSGSFLGVAYRICQGCKAVSSDPINTVLVCCVGLGRMRTDSDKDPQPHSQRRMSRAE